jgi:hypothetical protein
VTSLSKAWVCGRSLGGIAGSNAPGAWMSVSYDCCVSSGRGLCDRPMTCPEESYSVWCVWVWSWNLNNEEAEAYWGCRAMKKMCICNNVVKRFRPNPRTCQELQNMFLRPDGFIPSPKSQDKDPQFFGCLWLLIEYACIRRYFPSLDLVFSVRNLRMCHAFVTGTHSTLGGLMCTRWWINESIKFRESWLAEEIFASQEEYAPRSYLFSYQ